MSIVMILGDFLFIVLNMGLGVLLAAMFIAHNVYLPMIQSGAEPVGCIELDSDTGSVSPTSSVEGKEEIYEEKYDERYNELEMRELTEDQLKGLKNNILIETTPIGNILMFYDQDYEYFKYYSNSKEVPYKTLEAVAKKYVITNDCKQIYVDMSKEIERQEARKASESSEKEDEENKDEENKDEKGEPNEESVFANLKTYNVKDNKKVEPENVYIKEKINVYKYGGKIEEYTIIKKPAKEKVLKLDFASFKRMMGEADENKKSV